MDCQLFFDNALFLTCLSNKMLGQGGAFSFRHHPANNVSAEDVQNHVQVEISPFCRTLKLGNVPGPDLVWGCGQKLWLDVVGTAHMSSSVFNLLFFIQDAVHSAHRTEMGPFIQKGGIDLMG